MGMRTSNSSRVVISFVDEKDQYLIVATFSELIDDEEKKKTF